METSLQVVEERVINSTRRGAFDNCSCLSCSHVEILIGVIRIAVFNLSLLGVWKTGDDIEPVSSPIELFSLSSSRGIGLICFFTTIFCKGVGFDWETVPE